ncbi:hypothetical protein V8B97DRAFT_1864703 [Scleroderma yunnanense]
MRFINTATFLEKELGIDEEKGVNHRAVVLESRDDPSTQYAILSHRWIERHGKDMEVKYEDIVELAKIEEDKRDQVRKRDGYQKILHSCLQANRDGLQWIWVDTCCIDRRNSAELSEAIHSMYRWYENASVCYAYLHDVADSSFPSERHDARFPASNGWPEWFSRGWTLQELIAPRNVQFFNKDWQPIGDKKTLAHILTVITRIPKEILENGLPSNRPCVAQIMSWAADRTTTRLEDRAYSLLGLLGINMAMLYGEGKGAFQRLQREIIQTLNDFSIFAWEMKENTGRIGSVLADDPIFFRDCSDMEPIDPESFIDIFRSDIPDDELWAIETKGQLGSFPISNFGIQIWLPLVPCLGSRSVFRAILPCRTSKHQRPVGIHLVLRKSNYYYRYSAPLKSTLPTARQVPEFQQFYLRYQAVTYPDLTFELDEKMISEGGFTYCGTFPTPGGTTGTTLTVTSTNPLFVRVYANRKAKLRFAVGFGQWFGEEWIDVFCEEPWFSDHEQSWETFAEKGYQTIWMRGAERAALIAEARSEGSHHSQVYAMHTRIPRSIWNVKTSGVRKKCQSSNHIVVVEVIRQPGFCYGPQWTRFDVDVGGLMIHHNQLHGYELLVDGVCTHFWLASEGIKLGDYGYITGTNNFQCEGNIFVDLGSLAFPLGIFSRVHKIDGKYPNQDRAKVSAFCTSSINQLSCLDLHDPVGLSLPNNDQVDSLLRSLSTQLTDRYLVTMAIQTSDVHSAIIQKNWPKPCIVPESCESIWEKHTIKTPLCILQKPLVWHRDDPMEWRHLRQIM